MTIACVALYGEMTAAPCLNIPFAAAGCHEEQHSLVNLFPQRELIAGLSRHVAAQDGEDEWQAMLCTLQLGSCSERGTMPQYIQHDHKASPN